MADAPYDIVVYYKNEKAIIRNVNPNNYSFLHLVNEVCEAAIHDAPGNESIMIDLSCEFLGTSRMLDVSSDEDTRLMFFMYRKIRVINLHVKISNVAPLIVLDESALNLNDKINMNDGDRNASHENLASDLGVVNEDSDSGSTGRVNQD